MAGTGTVQLVQTPSNPCLPDVFGDPIRDPYLITRSHRFHFHSYPRSQADKRLGGFVQVTDDHTAEFPELFPSQLWMDRLLHLHSSSSAPNNS